MLDLFSKALITIFFAVCLGKFYRYQYFQIEQLEQECQKLNTTIQEMNKHNNILNSTLNSLLNYTLDNIDLDKVPKIQEICQKNSFDLLNIIDVTINLKLRQSEQKIERNNIKEAVQEYKALVDMKNDFSSISFEFNKKISVIIANIENKFYSAFLNLSDQISIQPKGFKVSDEIESELGTNLDYLIDFSRLMKQLYDDSTPEILINKEITNTLNEIFNKIDNLLKGKSHILENVLKDRDIFTLKQMLEVFNGWTKSLEKIRSCLHSTPKSESFNNFKKKVAKNILNLKDNIINTELQNSETISLEKQRDYFYEILNLDLEFLLQVKCLEIYQLPSIVDFSSIHNSALNSLNAKIENLIKMAQLLVDKLIAENISQNEYAQLDVLFNNLISLNKTLKIDMVDLREKITKLDSKIIDQIKKYLSNLNNENDFEKVCEYLIKAKTVGNKLFYSKLNIDSMIDIALLDYKKTNGATAINKLGTLLQKENGKDIISEHKIFNGYSIAVFNKKTRIHDINYVISELESDSLNKNKLRERFNQFEAEYTKLLDQYLTPNISLESLILNTLNLFGSHKQNLSSKYWNNNIKTKLPDLIAHIFSVITLKRTENYFEAEEKNKKESDYLFLPHPAQIVSILRSLGIGDDKEELQHNLVQIATGEGKSVTLAVLSSVFALLGFEVNVVCYSEYLSQRDYKDFQSLFDMLKITPYIRYGTFNKLSESLINQDGNIRKLLENMISNDANSAMDQNTRVIRPKILLVDEVDVFFSKDFYGNIYTPSALLKDPTITALTDFIWENRATLNYEKVQNSKQFNACCTRYSNWKVIVEEAVKNMLYDVKNFDSHDYIIKDDKIGYKEQDNIVFNLVYGYKTMFAYYAGFEEQKITKKSLEENINIILKSGSFSYAKIPQKFKYIIGVTGTLKSLSEPEKDVITNYYDIKKKTYAPSVFGKNNLKFTPRNDIFIENEHDYMNRIKTEINFKLHPNGLNGTKRAVLVFFESEIELDKFYNYLKADVIRLTEKASNREKDSYVKKATSAGQITLLTKELGRGTDFKCYDETVLNNGGVHVIQTFLSEELSEEVQIKGRSARQGDQGSYNMILLDKSLEKFNISLQDIENIKNGKNIMKKLWNTMFYPSSMYEMLNGERNNRFRKQYELNKEYLKIAETKHQNGEIFIANILAGNKTAVLEFLRQENKGPENVGSSRTICLMDATGSMTFLLQNAKNSVETMFERSKNILKENNFNEDSFQLQFAVYRNYNCDKDSLLQSSPWETKPNSLSEFMKNIQPDCGWGNEAIEIGLWHANNENENQAISQVILIGDMPANTESEIKFKREYFKSSNLYGEKYWSETKFKEKTFYKKELAKLKSKKIPVHSFYVTSNEATKSNFEEIAKETGGRFAFLDVNDPLKGAKILTDLVTEEILRNVGGNTYGDSLVNKYHMRYGRSYL